MTEAQDLAAIKDATMSTLSGLGVKSINFANEDGTIEHSISVPESAAESNVGPILHDNDPENFPTGPDTMGDEATLILGGEEELVNALIVLSTLDPLATNENGAIYTEDQRTLILSATEVVDGWRS